MWDGLDPRSHDSREREAAEDSARTSDVRDAFTSGLDLPRGLERERVHVDGRDYDLRGSEARILATVGAFRVVAIDDLRDDRGRPTERWRGDVEHLRRAGLIRVVAPLDRDGERTTLIALTERGHQVLETHRTTGHETPQRFFSRCRQASGALA